VRLTSLPRLRAIAHHMATAPVRRYLRFRIAEAQNDLAYYELMKRQLPACAANTQKSIDEWSTALMQLTPTQQAKP
jgi:hypothetical protein